MIKVCILLEENGIVYEAPLKPAQITALVHYATELHPNEAKLI